MRVKRRILVSAPRDIRLDAARIGIKRAIIDRIEVDASSALRPVVTLSVLAIGVGLTALGVWGGLKPEGSAADSNAKPAPFEEVAR